MLRDIKRTFIPNRRALSMLLSGMLVLVLAGCAAPPVKKEGPVFFPPPPNSPKVQFLKSIAGSKDVEEQSSTFSLLVRGVTKEDIKPIIKPYGITYDKGKLYVCDVQGLKVAIIDLVQKKFEFLKGNFAYGKLKKPINLAVDEAENLYVVDTIRKEILMYDKAGEFKATFGKGIAKKPVDVAVDENFLYILDLDDNDIKIVNRKNGELERSIGKTEGTTQGLSIPTNFTIDSKGFIYVTNVGTSSVTKLDKDGHILSSFGKMGDAFGEFTRPKGIAVDAQGRIFVVDGGVQNVQVFNDNARLLMFFGNPPLPAGAMNLPVGIAVTTDNLEFYQKMAEPGFIVEEVIFVTNQQGLDKVAIYALGHMEESKTPKAEGQKMPADEKKQGEGAPKQGEIAPAPAKEGK